MAALDFQRSARISGTFGQFFAKAFATFKTWNDNRATRKSLSKLTDHELEDIGLIRGDVEAMRFSGLSR